MREWYRDGAELLREIGDACAAPNEVAAWYIGQVGYVLKGNCVLCIDPFLNDLTDDNGKSLRLYQPPFASEQFMPDFVLCTHGHADHMALPTLCAMAAGNPHTKFIVPDGCVDEMVCAGIAADRVIGMKAHQPIELPDFTVRPVQAAHPVHALDAQGRDIALCLSIRINDVELLHLGDTYLTQQLLDDLMQLPQPDVLFTPINGGDYFRTASNCIGNLNAQESARLAVLLRAKLTIPTHFDCIAGNTCEPWEFMRLLWQENASARFRIPALGEQLRLTCG